MLDHKVKVLKRSFSVVKFLYDVVGQIELQVTHVVRGFPMISLSFPVDVSELIHNFYETSHRPKMRSCLS
jgi:hypothetical protein